MERLLDAVERRSLEREKEEGGETNKTQAHPSFAPPYPKKKIETDQVDTD